jgi:hypothetical protein
MAFGGTALSRSCRRPETPRRKRQSGRKWDVLVEAQEQFVELVCFSPQIGAAPGEIVSAMVRVGKAKPTERYRLSANVSKADVRILGEAQAFVRGSETAIFRFTNSTSGRAGISVEVERIGTVKGSGGG